ncbi:MAG: chloride channel protein [Bacillus sp. (in: Bacteria)]|nr:chloride channel protein [Bacillus sp. (in: firmicutes)]
MQIIEEKNQRKQSLIVLVGLLCLIMTYIVFNLIHIQLWRLSVTPVDSVIKPLLLFPFVFLGITFLFKWTSSAVLYIRSLADREVRWNSIRHTIKKAKSANVHFKHSVVAGAFLSIIAYPLWHLFLGTALTPVDYVLKPFILLPVSIAMAQLLMSIASFIWRCLWELDVTYINSPYSSRIRLLNKTDGRGLLYLEVSNGVDKRYDNDDDESILFHLLGKDMLLKRSGAFKVSCIPSLLQPKNRLTTSKMWLRLIRGPTENTLAPYKFLN